MRCIKCQESIHTDMDGYCESCFEDMMTEAEIKDEPDEFDYQDILDNSYPGEYDEEDYDDVYADEDEDPDDSRWPD